MLSRQTQCDQLLKYKVAKSYPKVSTAVFNIKIAQKTKITHFNTNLHTIMKTDNLPCSISLQFKNTKIKKIK